MVSTRSIKFKDFSEGEKVLCYEPDPAKTKVLYNSKVLEVTVKKDATGKKVAHFLIHFQGWNSTWDRFVTEDYILKDTEDNRKLQRELAEKAQLTAGCGNLYRKDRKKRLLPSTLSAKSRLSPPARELSVTVDPTNNAASSPASSSGAKAAGVKRRHSTSDDPPTVNNHQGSEEHSDTEGGNVPRTVPVKSSQFNVSQTLRNWLDKDYDRIKMHNKVLRLWKEFKVPPKGHHTNKKEAEEGESMRQLAATTIYPKVELVLIRLPADPPAIDVLQKWMIDYSLSQIRLMCHRRGHLRPSAGKKGSNVTVDSITRSANLCREVADSLRVFMEFGLSRMFLYEEEKEQYSHVIRSHDPTPRNESPIDLDDEYAGHEEKPPVEFDDDGNEGEARRKTLRSHSGGSFNSQEIDIKPDLATLLTNDCLNDGGETLALRPMSIKENEGLKKILTRKLVQDSYRTQKHPSTVYGAVHLSRVLVKMPDVLSNAEYGEPKLSLLVEYLNNFMKYLEEHPEWFGDCHYIDKPPTSIS